MPLYVQETYRNATERYLFGESDVYETAFEETGELYRCVQREYGRCVSKIYIDGENGKPIPIGWVFQSRDKYEDTGETYLREVWVTVHDQPDTVTRKHHYHKLGA